MRNKAQQDILDEFSDLPWVNDPDLLGCYLLLSEPLGHVGSIVAKIRIQLSVRGTLFITDDKGFTNISKSMIRGLYKKYTKLSNFQ